MHGCSRLRGSGSGAAAVIASLTLALNACTSNPAPPTAALTASPPVADASPTAQQPTASSARVDCVSLPQVQPGECATILDAIRQADASDFVSASRVVVVPKCPPMVACESDYIYDLIALLVPAGNDTSHAVAFHVYGHLGFSLRVDPWVGPLPEHASRMLTQGQ